MVVYLYRCWLVVLDWRSLLVLIVTYPSQSRQPVQPPPRLFRPMFSLHRSSMSLQSHIPLPSDSPLRPHPT